MSSFGDNIPPKDRVSNLIISTQPFQTANSPYTLRIDGIEVSQAIQFFRAHKHVNPNYVRPDNSVPLVEGKPLVLRIYPSLSGWLNFDLQSPSGDSSNSSGVGNIDLGIPSSNTVTVLPKYVDGWLEYKSPFTTNNWVTAQKINGPIVGRVFSIISKGDVNQTLNFMINASHVQSLLTIRAKIWVSNYVGTLESNIVQGTLTLEQMPNLRFHVVRFNYDVTLDLDRRVFEAVGIDVFHQDFTDFAEKIMPVGKGTYQVVGDQEYDLVFDNDTAPANSLGFFSAVIDILKQLKGDSTEIYVGLLPNGLPQGIHYTEYSGQANNEVFVYKEKDPHTLAHELAHALGRSHAPCSPAGLPDDVDPAYPFYTDMWDASIGEYGIEANPHTISPSIEIKNPQTHKDVMGYCEPQWISPYHYMRLIHDIQDHNAYSVNIGSKVGAIKMEHLFLRFVINRSKGIKILPSFHYVSYPIRRRGKWTPFVVELRNHDNETIESQRVLSTFLEQSSDQANLHFMTIIPFSPKIESLKIVFDPEGYAITGKEIYSLEVPKFDGKFEFTQHIDYNTNEIRLNWEVREQKKGSLYYLVRYSNDDGKNWRNLTASMQETSYRKQIHDLAAGEKCKFQILATQGIKTILNTGKSFEIEHPESKDHVK